MSFARNAGIKVAQGEFVNFIDSDDTIPADSLENLVDLQKQNDADLVCCTFLMYCENNDIKKSSIADKFIELSKIKADEMEIFLSNLFSGPCTKLYRNNIIKKHNILFDVDIYSGEDTIFVHEYLSMCSSVQCSNTIVYNYLRNGYSASSKAFENYWMFILKVFEARIRFCDHLSLSDDCKACYNLFTIMNYMEFVVNNYLHHYNYEKAVETLTKMYNNFAKYFIKKEKVVEDFISYKNGKRLLKAYRLLSSKNGVEKYCKYKLRQKRINDFKTKLKQVRIINSLNNLIKGRK